MEQEESLSGGVLVIDPSYFCTRVWHCRWRPSERQLWSLFTGRRLIEGQQLLDLHQTDIDLDIVDMHLLGPCVTKVLDCEAVFIRDDTLGTAVALKTRLLATVKCLKEVPIYLVENQNQKNRRTLYVSE